MRLVLLLLILSFFSGCATPSESTVSEPTTPNTPSAEVSIPTEAPIPTENRVELSWKQQCFQAWGESNGTDVGAAGPDIPEVDGKPCNVVAAHGSVLHFMNVEPSQQPDRDVVAVSNGESYDWLQLDHQGRKIWIWPGGQDSPRELIDLPELEERPGFHTQYWQLSAAHLEEAGETHAVLQVFSRHTLGIGAHGSWHALFHVWWSGLDKVESELIHLNEEPRIWGWVPEIVQDQGQVVTAGGFGTAGGADGSETRMFTTDSGSLDESFRISDMRALGLAAAAGVVQICSTQDLPDHELVSYASSANDWRQEDVFHFREAKGHTCLVTNAVKPVIVVWGSPLIGGSGGGGDGSPGSGSVGGGRLMVGWRGEDRWDNQALDRFYGTSIDLTTIAGCPLLLLGNTNGTSEDNPQDNLELVGPAGSLEGDWIKWWGDFGSRSRFVEATQNGLAVQAKNFQNPPWKYHGWAVLEMPEPDMAPCR